MPDCWSQSKCQLAGRHCRTVEKVDEQALFWGSRVAIARKPPQTERLVSFAEITLAKFTPRKQVTASGHTRRLSWACSCPRSPPRAAAGILAFFAFFAFARVTMRAQNHIDRCVSGLAVPSDRRSLKLHGALRQQCDLLWGRFSAAPLAILLCHSRIACAAMPCIAIASFRCLSRIRTRPRARSSR